MSAVRLCTMVAGGGAIPPGAPCNGSRGGCLRDAALRHEAKVTTMQDHGSRNKSTISSQHLPARVAMAATAVPSARIPHAQAHLVASGVAGPGAVATRAAGRAAWSRWGLLSAGLPRSYCRRCAAQLDTLGIEPRASRMLSGCDTTTPRAHDHHAAACLLSACARW